MVKIASLEKMNRFERANVLLSISGTNRRKWSELAGERVDVLGFSIVENPDSGKPGEPDTLRIAVCHHAGELFTAWFDGGFMSQQANLVARYLPFSAIIEEVEWSPANGYRFEDGTIDDISDSVKPLAALLAGSINSPALLAETAEGN